jgi:hypothetical protein
MKITRNTSIYSSRDLRRVICHTHRFMVKLEGKPAPNWKRLRVVIGGRTEDGHTSGRAHYGGRGWNGWDVWFTLPDRGMTEHRFCWLVYHELMHTYGYRHRQYTNIKPAEQSKLFPDNKPLALKPPPPPKPIRAPKPTTPPPPPVDIVRVRYDRMKQRQRTWDAKQRRAANALEKVNREIRAYERRHGDRLVD